MHQMASWTYPPQVFTSVNLFNKINRSRFTITSLLFQNSWIKVHHRENKVGWRFPKLIFFILGQDSIWNKQNLWILLGKDSPFSKFIHLKIRRRGSVESLTIPEEGEFKVPIDGCIRLMILTTISVTETSFKMASTHCQKWLTIFCQKAQNYVLFAQYDFAQISTACGLKHLAIMYWETFDTDVSISSYNIKYPIGKSIFAVNLPSELFRVTVANADIGSIKSLHTLIWKLFVPHANKIWTKSYGPNYTKFWAFWQKKKTKQNKTKTKTNKNKNKNTGFFKTIFDKQLTPCWKTFMWLKQLFSFQTTSFQCFKNYGSLTRVTRLKVAPNMTDPIRI